MVGKSDVGLNHGVNLKLVAEIETCGAAFLSIGLFVPPETVTVGVGLSLYPCLSKTSRHYVAQS